MLKADLEDVFEEEDDVTETEAAAAEQPLLQQVTEEDLQRQTQLVTKLSAQQIRHILDDVCTEMLSGLEVLATLLSNYVDSANNVKTSDHRLTQYISRYRTSLRRRVKLCSHL